MDRYISRSDSRQLTKKEKIGLLIEYSNINKKYPFIDVKYKNYNVGNFFGTCKNIIETNKDELYKELSVCKYIKDVLDRFLLAHRK